MIVTSFRFVAILVAVVFCSLAQCVVGQEAYADDDLRAMSDDELEQLCVVRGFEILKDEIDPATGLAYELSHDDFVEAAHRCLDIEQEMNELLAEYPELANELEEEIKKLEEENAERRTEVEGLEQKLGEAQEEVSDSAKSEPGPAFVSSSDSSTVGVEEDDFEVIDGGDAIADEANVDMEDMSSTTESTTQLNESEPPIEAADETKEAESVIEEDSSLAEKNTTASDEDFTLKAIGFEIVRTLLKQAETDLKRIVELMAPVIHPILRAGDAAWRQLKVTVSTLQKNYEASRQGDDEKGDEVQS